MIGFGVPFSLGESDCGDEGLYSAKEPGLSIKGDGGSLDEFFTSSFIVYWSAFEAPLVVARRMFI